MRIPALFAAAALVPLSVGCLQQVDYIEPESNGFFGIDSDYTDISSNIRDSVLSGRFGPQEVLEEGTVANNVSGYTDSYGGSNVTLKSERDGRMGMLIIDTYDASLLTLPAGTYRSSSTQASQVGVLVCSNSDFDAPANDANVIISDQPDGTRDITVEAVVNEQANYGMDNSDNPAIGEFTIVR